MASAIPPRRDRPRRRAHRRVLGDGRWNEEYEDIDERRALRVLAEWRLDHLADRTFGTLSATASRSACRSPARS